MLGAGPGRLNDGLAVTALCFTAKLPAFCALNMAQAATSTRR
jgi:hypothetical protein